MPYIQCWEYYVFDVDPEDDNLEKELNDIGLSGWDMCGVFPEDGVIIFKKPTDGIKSYTGSGHKRRQRPSKSKDKVMNFSPIHIEGYPHPKSRKEE